MVFAAVVALAWLLIESWAGSAVSPELRCALGAVIAAGLMARSGSHRETSGDELYIGRTDGSCLRQLEPMGQSIELVAKDQPEFPVQEFAAHSLPQPKTLDSK